MSGHDSQLRVPNEHLLRALAEQLKSPLLRISYEAEAKSSTAWTEVAASADSALRLLDAYLLATEQQKLDLEPVSISAVLYDVGQALDALVRQSGGELEISVAGKYGPVMAHPKHLEAALVSMGHSLLEASADARPRLVLSAYKSSRGIVAGVFGNYPALSATAFNRALTLSGKARQPLPTAHAMNGAGLYIADALVNSMESRLRVARYHRLTGLAASFLPSKQLQLI